MLVNFNFLKSGLILIQENDHARFSLFANLIFSLCLIALNIIASATVSAVIFSPYHLSSLGSGSDRRY